VAGAAHIIVVVVVAPVVASTVVAPAFLAPATSLEAAAVSLLPVAATAVPVRVLLAHRVVALHPASPIVTARVAVPAVATAAAVPVAAAPLPATEPAAAAAVRLLVRLLLEETLQLRLYHMHRARQPELRFERRPDLGCEPLLNREHRVERVPSERLRGHWTRGDRNTRTGPASKDEHRVPCLAQGVQYAECTHAFGARV
jgi:hypothetical protein